MKESGMLVAMAGTAGSLATAVSGADSRATVLEDRVDVEDHAAFLWLRAHQLHGYGKHHAVIGKDILSSGWNAQKMKFNSAHSAEIYLDHFVQNASAMRSLQMLAQSLSAASLRTPSKAEVISTIAANLFSGRVWLIELPPRGLKSRFITKTSPEAFSRINPKYGTRVDFAFIAALEGDQWLRGYVPMRKDQVIGRSGMTVASGFDLGQWKPDELQALGFPQDLLDKIKPFAYPNYFKGMNKAEVVAKVTKLGPVPVLTKEQADLCDGAVFGKILGEAIGVWNSRTAPGVPKFTTLPAGWQTVWLSRLYQEGNHAKAADAIAFRSAATSGKWADAIAKLRAYSEYKSRAAAEANLLETALPPPVVVPGPKAPR